MYLLKGLFMCVGIILGMGSANERRCYIVMSSLIGWAHTQNDPCVWFPTCLIIYFAWNFYFSWWPTIQLIRFTEQLINYIHAGYNENMEYVPQIIYTLYCIYIFWISLTWCTSQPKFICCLRWFHLLKYSPLDIKKYINFAFLKSNTCITLFFWEE